MHRSGTELQSTVCFLLLTIVREAIVGPGLHQHGFPAVTVARGCIVCVVVAMKLNEAQ